jgi:IrrE N-terminal-like domain
MKWVKDRSGKFAERPHYLPDEMDIQCEKVVTEFLGAKKGRVEYPLSTDDITVLVESMTQDLDLYADLTSEGADVEGVTDFFRGLRPRVRIEKRLTADARMTNRLRTTLTHELGHVVFHDFLFQGGSNTSLFDRGSKPESNKCKRDNIVGAPNSDWMEWQAGFACGAFLMPASAVRECVRDYVQSKGLSIPRFGANSVEGQGLITAVVERFAVSHDAARVRLLQKGALSEGATGGSLF